MTRRDHRNGLDQVAQQMPTPEGSWQEVLELLAEHGFDGMAGAIETLFNEALKLAVAEMYLQGVSTRKVTAVMEELCGFEVTSMQVSRAVRNRSRPGKE